MVGHNQIHIAKCTFGEKCRYRHEIDPDYKKKEEVVVGKNNKDNVERKGKMKGKIKKEKKVTRSTYTTETDGYANTRTDRHTDR